MLVQCVVLHRLWRLELRQLAARIRKPVNVMRIRDSCFLYSNGMEVIG